MLQRGEFAAAEQHIASAARAQHNAATLRQRWRLLEQHVGLPYTLRARRALLEYEGLTGKAHLEYELLGARGKAQVQMDVIREGDALVIERVSFSF
ncbi:MAG: hypothetical protein NZ556_08525 [Fimbriimonadales bacterium]|nr:hypothetical protein [Fimbriimonadales bacterium]